MKNLTLITISFLFFGLTLLPLSQGHAQVQQPAQGRGKPVTIEQVPSPYKEQILKQLKEAQTPSFPPSTNRIMYICSDTRQIGCYTFQVCEVMATGQRFLSNIESHCIQ